MPNKSTSPERPELDADGPIAVVASLLIVGAVLLGLVWWLIHASDTSERVAGSACLIFAVLLFSGLFRNHARERAALDRARARGGLTQIVHAYLVDGGNGEDGGYLTLHGDAGDIGFYSWSARTGRDLYIARHSIHATTRVAVPRAGASAGPTPALQIDWLGDRIESRTFLSQNHDLGSWSTGVAGEESAREEGVVTLPRAIARIRDDD